MVDIARPAPRTVSWAPLAGIASLVTAGAIAMQLVPGDAAGLQNFLLVFASLLIEAVPFVLLGAVVSAAIEVFVPGRFFAKLAALPGPVQLPAAGLAGMAFPVCECGSVPVARRLAHKGLNPGAAVTFMLAAPVLNPVVLASTAVAYRGRDVLWPMILGRAGLGLAAAMAVGWVLAASRPGELLRVRDSGHDHDHHTSAEPAGRGRRFFAHLAGDFFFMARWLILGAAVAAMLQTLVPQSIIASVASTPVVNLLAMMALAFVLSLCSEADAFVAASFVQFGVGGQLAFLVFGPMVDTKLGFLYSATFTRGFFRTVIVVVGAVVLAGTLWLEVLLG